MLKSVSLLIALIFFSRPVLPLVSYVLNYDYVVTELCINKDNTNTKCHGKCQLKKELANASHSESGSQHQQKGKFAEIELFFLEPFPLLIPMPAAETCPAQFTYLNEYRFLQMRGVWHPPALG